MVLRTLVSGSRNSTAVKVVEGSMRVDSKHTGMAGTMAEDKTRKVTETADSTVILDTDMDMVRKPILGTVPVLKKIRLAWHINLK